MESPNRRLVTRGMLVLVGLAVATFAGTFGYMIVEGWGFVDSLYMTIITLSTVGLSEVQPLSNNGKLFTSLLIVFGVGAVLYMLAALAEFFVEGRLNEVFRRERMAHQVRQREGHVIVAGFGRFGRVVARELMEAGREPVILDQDPEIAEELERAGYPYVIGSASSDEDLARCGIAGAASIVAGTPSEAENVFITLAARELNPAIRIHARCETEAGARRLRRAGADQVAAPFQMGGSRVATSILRPAVVDFLELASPLGTTSVGIEEVLVELESEYVGLSVGEAETRSAGCRIVAVQSQGGEMQAVPQHDRRIEAGDLIVVLGEQDDLLEVAERARSGED